TRDLNLGKVALYQLSYSRLVNEGVFYGFGRMRQPLFSTFCFISFLWVIFRQQQGAAWRSHRIR
ncbi:hypothetical protein, partial [Marinobacter sp.]|uniref:hypothetical protein n=1 Tax=Marinobacter sp. TaxID=50741 RepID=UPI0034A2AD5B